MYKDNQKHQTSQRKEWTLEDTLEKGRIRVEITTSRSQKGAKIYSVSIHKRVLDREGNPVLDHNNEEKRTRFYRREDMNIISDLCQEAQHWIEADRHEDRQNQSTKNVKRTYIQRHT